MLCVKNGDTLMNQLSLFKQGKKLMSLQEASKWASQYLDRKVTVSNISYLLQYGRIKKYGNNGNPLIDIDELKNYYIAVFICTFISWFLIWSCQLVKSAQSHHQTTHCARLPG